jgi:hypothetical protein
MNEIIQAIADELKTQDNRSTAEPIYVVQQQRRVYGFDPDYTDGTGIVWLNGPDCCEADEKERVELNAEYERTGECPVDWMRTCYQDTWEFVQPFFTLKGAESFIEENAHRLTDPRVYVDSAYRNKEWMAIRELLKTVAKEEP